MKKILFASLLILKPILCSAQQDSTRIYPVLKWKLDVLLDAFHYDLPACNRTVVDYSHAADSLKLALVAGEKVIELRTEQRDLKVIEATQWHTLYINSEDKRVKEGMKYRKKLIKTTLVAIGEAAVIIVFLL